MNSDLYKSGLKLLRSLGKNAELIMNAYSYGEIDEIGNESTIETLTANHVLWQPNPEEGMRLTKEIRSLIEKALRDERNCQINFNIGSAIARVKTHITHYKEAILQDRARDTERHQRDINEDVYIIVESLREDLTSLWEHINNEFGLVLTIDAKIRENKLAQQQVKDILEGLDMFDFKELTELAGDDRILRKLLIVNLQREVESCSNSLHGAQVRLYKMLGHFKELKSQSVLVQGFQNFIDNNPEYEPQCYPEQSWIPTIFNLITPLKLKGYADINREEYETEFVKIVQSLKNEEQQQLIDDRSESGAILIHDQEKISYEESYEYELLDQFFCYVIDSKGTKISAVNYFNKIDTKWENEFWLFGVIGHLDSLDKQAQKLFTYKMIDQQHPIFTGNYYIKDIELWIH